jgi:5-methylcytosine-specific restriction endonuclease McrBC GTP-binding regulatory subunit McrB
MIKATAYLSEAPFRYSTLGLAQGLIHKKYKKAENAFQGKTLKLLAIKGFVALSSGWLKREIYIINILPNLSVLLIV